MAPLAPHYEYQPSFILGFHGCSAATAEQIFSSREGEHLRPSEKDYDWLGSGIYFWEGSYTRALEWAQAGVAAKKIEQPAVIGAVIDLRHCLDLFDRGATEQLREAHSTVRKNYRALGLRLPKNTGGTPDRGLRKLDCLVITTLHRLVEEHTPEQQYASVRGPFLEGKAVYPTAGFRSHTHIQICVRDTACIKGYFRPIVPALPVSSAPAASGS